MLLRNKHLKKCQSILETMALKSKQSEKGNFMVQLKSVKNEPGKYVKLYLESQGRRIYAN